MALGTLAGYYAWAQATADGGAADASIGSHLVMNADTLKRFCAPYEFEDRTASWTLDAPCRGPELFLPAGPVRSITALYYRSDANGVAANFTSDYLLVEGTDFVVDYDMPVEGWSKSRKVTHLKKSFWGVRYVRPHGCLAAEPRDEPKSVRVTAAVGHTVVPPAAEQALYIMTALTRGRRATGAPVASNSWNGYSESFAGPLTSTAALYHPDVQAKLAPFVTQIRLGS